MYTYSTLYLHVYCIPSTYLAPSQPFDGGCVSWSFTIAAVYYLVLGLVTYLAHGSLAENRLKETRIMHCTTVDPVWSRSHEDVSHHWHTVGPHGLYIQVMICTQSSPKTWATWHQMRKLCCGEGWPLQLAQAHMGSQSRKVKKDILMISCSTLLVFLFTPAWINRPVRCQVSISIARMARLAT